MKALINGKIIYKDNVLENKILVFNDKIVDICDALPSNCEVIDAKGLYISPGLIDIHIHGSFNCDAMDESIESVKTISEGIINNGVTSFLPTTMTMSKKDIYNALNNIRTCMNDNLHGAKVLGTHLEGPFINNDYKGAQSNEYIIAPSLSFINDYKDVIKIISYAPEKDINFEFTKDILNNTNIVLSIAHSNSTYNMAKDVINLGVSNITHLFNAMSPLNHREMGVVGAALTSKVYAEIICDNIHVTPNMYQFVLDNKTKDYVVLVTDSMRAGCMKDGKYDLGGQDVFVKDGAARLASGNLAGSILTLNKAVYNFMKHTNLNIAEAIGLASINPAKSIKVDDNKGSLEIHKDADIAVFDENMNCYMSIVEGKIINNNL